MPLMNMVVGAALLLFGRRLFWLFVAGVGFVVGALFAAQGFGGKSDWVTIAVALAAGVIGALVSVVLQRLVVGAAGFLAGGFVLYTLAFELQHESLAWIAFTLGGVLGAVLMWVLFDWALIILSSLTGAIVITQNVALTRSASAGLFLGLLILGVVVQTAQGPRAARAPKPGES